MGSCTWQSNYLKFAIDFFQIFVSTYLLMWLYNQYLVKAYWRRLLMSASLASNHWALGPGYRGCSNTWILVFSDFFFHWVWLWCGMVRVSWSCDQCSAICLFSWNLVALVKFTRVLNTLMSIESRLNLFFELPCLFLSKRLSFVRASL
jgi:hypothetical protein